MYGCIGVGAGDVRRDGGPDRAGSGLAGVLRGGDFERQLVLVDHKAAQVGGDELFTEFRAWGEEALHETKSHDCTLRVASNVERTTFVPLRQVDAECFFDVSECDIPGGFDVLGGEDGMVVVRCVDSASAIENTGLTGRPRFHTYAQKFQICN